ncbi:hypothetical protein, partial [Salmonella enterica]|uniref:hypothetical protein n=1 Tax=Salmonella enterica TaxID=28901 RepID=UPI003075B1D1
VIGGPLTPRDSINLTYYKNKYETLGNNIRKIPPINKNPKLKPINHRGKYESLKDKINHSIIKTTPYNILKEYEYAKILLIILGTAVGLFL